MNEIVHGMFFPRRRKNSVFGTILAEYYFQEKKTGIIKKS